MSEADEQKAIVKWFRETYPQYALSLRISQSGGYRGSGMKGGIRSKNIKAMGAITGESDLALLLPRGGYGSLLIEHKAEGGAHKPTDKQIEYMAYHKWIGNCAVITTGIEMAKAVIYTYIEQGKLWERDDVQ